MARRLKNNAAVFAAILAASALATGIPALGQSAKPANSKAAAAAQAREQVTAEATRLFQSTDPAEQASAIDIAHKVIDTWPGYTSHMAVSGWLKTLMAQKQYAAAEELAQRDILSRADMVKYLEEFEKVRIQALLALDKKDEALSAAKSLFNAASMHGASDALALVASCLAAADDGGNLKVEAFKKEQLAGAAPAAGAVTPPLRSAVLDAVKIDAKAYEAPLAQAAADTYESLITRGNLLLLADRGKDARAVFEQAYAIVPEAKKPQAAENIARAIKAQDGTIARANAWVLALRPKTAPH